jgi:hypothetical protein
MEDGTRNRMNQARYPNLHKAVEKKGHTYLVLQN